MSDRSDSVMNLKLKNDLRDSANKLNKPPVSIKEERRRTGRYIAILVGISLFLLAIYHAWVRRIPVVASLVIPALIMFVYVGWVLYTASRDKHKLFDLEGGMNRTTPEDTETDISISDFTQTNLDISAISTRENSKSNTAEDPAPKDWTEVSAPYLKGENTDRKEGTYNFIKPIILINDRLPEDFDQIWTNISDNVSYSEKLKMFQTRRKFKRKFCRSRRHAAFKRCYTIG